MKEKISSLLVDHRMELMAWICRLLFSAQDFKEWCCRISILFVLYNTVSCLIGSNGFVRRRRVVLSSPANLVERVRRLPFLCSGYAVVIASCYIALFRFSLLELCDSLLDSGVGSFYDLVIGPLASQFAHPSQGDSRSAHRTHVPRYHGVPGRHNGRRATKRSRARPPPFRCSCVRRTPSIDRKTKKMKKKRTGLIPDFPPKRFSRCKLAYRRRLARSLVHHFVDSAFDDPIGQDFEITNIFGPQIGFSGYNPEFSLPVANFKCGFDIQPAPSLLKTKLRCFYLPITKRMQECARRSANFVSLQIQTALHCNAGVTTPKRMLVRVFTPMFL